jgi:hypothetical protein
LTTSNTQLPKVLFANLPEGNVKEYHDFTFDDEEIEECLINNGIESRFLSYKTVIAARSHRNPQMVLAITYYLKSIQRDNDDDDDLFDKVFNGDFAEELSSNAQRSISKYITNDNTRELLYRLSLINWEFSLKEVKAISEVAQIIPHPGEHLSQLINVWIQSSGEKQYQISPLIKDLGTANLTETVACEVHLAYANSIITGQSVNQRTAMRAIISFINGKEPDSAGILLLNFYQHATDKQGAQLLNDWGYLLYWSSVPFPNEMSVSLSITIKLEQLRLNQILKKDIRKGLFDIDKYLTIIGYLLEKV